MKLLTGVFFILLSLNVFSQGGPKLYPTESELKEIFSEIRPELKGVEGYRYIADTYFLGNMQKAFMHTSEVKGISFIKSLGWGNAYHGSTTEHEEERSRILNEDGSVKERYVGRSGYINYANDFYEGSMLKTHMNVSSVLSKKEMDNAGWGNRYAGSTREHEEERSRILNEDGSVKERYAGRSGYINYANEFYEGSMKKTHMNVSSVLSKKEMDNAGWGNAYQGSTTEHEEERARILNEDGSIKEKYLGREGYVKYANEFYEGSMKKTYMNVSSVLSKKEMDNAGWGNAYQGSTREHEEERSRILNEDGSVKERYAGRSGYINYANDFYEGSMKKTYMNVSSVFSKKEMDDAGWGNAYLGATEEYLKEHSKITDKDGAILKKYQGQLGLRDFAIDYYDNNMFKAYVNISAVVSEDDKASLSWMLFPGKVKDFDAIREMLSGDGEDIDYQKYFGKKAGIDLAVIEYMTILGHELPYKKEVLAKVRQQIRNAVTKEEKISLGWDSVNSTKAVRPLPKTKNKLKDIKAFDPKLSIKKASRK